MPHVDVSDVVAGGLALEVEAPRRKQLGSYALYRVTIRNGGDQPAKGVTVRCDFDDPLVFRGSDLRRVTQAFDRLEPGEAKDLALSLYSAQPGLHCCRFTVASEQESASVPPPAKTVCVDFVSRQLSIDMLGPTRRTEGSRAEFNITLANLSVQTLSNVRAILTFDQALVAREASAGAQVGTGRLVWELGTLQPLESIQLQSEFECRGLARRACVGIEVQTSELAPEQDETCLEVVPVPGTLDLRLSDLLDPLTTGQTGIYEATVHNLGLQAARRLSLEANLPEQLRLVSATVLEGDRDLRLGHKVEEGNVIFDELDSLAADARLTIRLEVQALTPGLAELTVRLTSSLSQTPVLATEPTLIADP
ncbi:MAG: hypothetical protein ACKV0T_03225 [Planctomycetales bacterium]